MFPSQKALHIAEFKIQVVRFIVLDHDAKEEALEMALKHKQALIDAGYITNEQFIEIIKGIMSALQELDVRILVNSVEKLKNKKQADIEEDPE